MNLLDVDFDAPRRVEGITAAGLKALGEGRQRAEDLDKAADEMFERQEQARQRLDEQVKAAAKPEVEAEKPLPKRTLSLGAEEFHQPRQAGTPTQAPKDAAKPEPKVEPLKKPRPRPESEDDMSGRTWLR